MKKLEKLKLHNYNEICVSEQVSLRGGGEWRIGDDGNRYWYVGEVEVIYDDNPECPRCEQNKENGIVFDFIYGSGGNESPTTLQTLIEFFCQHSSP